MQQQFGDLRVEERYWAKVKVNEITQCWEFQGDVPLGYGRVFVRGRRGQMLAHRFWYERLVGPIAKGRVIDHLCRVRCCVNPQHLEAVTAAENSRRSPLVMKMIEESAARERAKTHCPKGHPYDADNTKPIRNGSGRACRICQRAAQRAYHAQNRETERERKLAHYYANHEERKAKMRAAYHQRKAKPKASNSE